MALFLGKNVVFIDSMQFMNSSLDKLVKNLVDEDSKCLVKEFDSKNLDILKQKSACPYEYINSFKRFNEEKLCARRYFFSSTKKGKIDKNGKISNGHVSIEHYLTCKKIWNKFKMKNIGDYHDHYLKKDVLLLADVFEKFIKTCLKYYELDPCHYFSSPGLSWDAMLKMTDVKLEKISGIDNYLFIEKGSRGGISYITKRYAKANDKYMSDYDLEKPSTLITYLDKNNFYYFAAIHEIKPVLMLNKPIYVGFTVLELSKWIMYDFHYNFIKKNFNAELLFTDADSLTYEIKSENVYEEFFKWKDLFDLSNYSKDSKFFDDTNKKLLAK